MNNESAAFLFDGEIWQAGEKRAIPIDRAFELYAFEGRDVSTKRESWTLLVDPAMDAAERSRRITVAGNEGVPSVAMAVRDYGTDVDGTVMRDRDHYIVDDPTHVVAHVLGTFNDFMSGRRYDEGENVAMYPEEYERARMLGLASKDAVRMRAILPFSDVLAPEEGVKRSSKVKRGRGSYFLATPAHADEIEGQHVAVRVGRVEWEAHHGKPRSYIHEWDTPDKPRAAIHGSTHMVCGYAD